jgi:YVTN family beta-propeller protein
LLTFLCFLLCSDAIARTLYITNSVSNSVSVVDVETWQVIREVSVGREPFGLAFSPDGKYAYVANAKSRELSVIDTSEHRLLRNIPLDSELPVWVAVNPDGTYIYVSNEGSNDLTIIAAASLTVVSRVPVGRGPAGIAVSPDGRQAYVANEGSNDVSLIDLQREVATQTIPVGQVPQGIAASPDGARLYVANFGSHSVSVLSVAQREVAGEIPVGEGPVGIFITSDGLRVFTGNFYDGSLSIVDHENYVIRSVPVGAEAFGVAASPDGREVYVVNGSDRQISVVDVPRRTVTRRLSLGEGPFNVAIVPGGSSGFDWRHFWIMLFMVAVFTTAMFATKANASAKVSAWLLLVIFVLGFSLRVTGLDWGIPVHEPATVAATPGLRVSFHLDEDNFLWNLTRVRPQKFDFYVSDFHWGTLQYYLVEVALLAAQAVGWVSSPWRESFFNFDPTEYARLFMAGRAVSAILGSGSILLIWAVATRLFGRETGILAALVLAILPLHVVNSHFLTSDISMVFFFLLALGGLISTLQKPSERRHGLTGLVTGLAITAKYNASFLILVAAFMHLVTRLGGWKQKRWFYVGLTLGFLIGEPYALTHRQQFWQSVKPYLQVGSLPAAAAPGTLTLLGLQLKNMLLFGLGIPLAAALLLAVASATLGSGLQSFSKEQETGRVWKGRVAGFFQALRDPLHRMLVINLLLLLLTVVLLRQPLIRYTLPLAVFLVLPLAHFLSRLSFNFWGRALVVAILFFTGLSSLLQVKILTQEHTVNQAFQWIERHVPAGASIKKGWPEIPVLNPEKFRISNFFAQEKMADFRGYFRDVNGQSEFPDYVLLDSLPTLEMPPEFVATLQEHYCLVAEFVQMPQLGKLKLPEWKPPHDWRYTHPSVRIYRLMRRSKPRV